MSAATNRYGLSRNIPEDVKRQVRQRCGFGCVVCGLALTDYEHVDPTFSEAKFHDPEAIVLLCPTHHAAVTRGQMSKSRVLEYSKKPTALSAGFTHGAFEVSDRPLTVTLGNLVCEDTPRIITVGAIPLLSFSKSAYPDEPWQMSAVMADLFGNPLLTVRENIWRASTARWDIQSIGNRLIIRNGAKNIGLRLRHEPGNHLIFEQAKLSFAGIKLECNEDEGILFTQPNGDRKLLNGGHFKSCSGAISFGVPHEAEQHVEFWIKRMGDFYSIPSTKKPFKNIPFHY
ncbi:hypothetical protein [Deinococcus sp. PESE-13]